MARLWESRPSPASGGIAAVAVSTAAESSSLPPVEEPSTSREWRGTAAVGGVVRVHTTAEATEQTFAATFTVSDRPSPWRSMWSYRQGPEPIVRDVEPQGGVLLGANCPEVIYCVPTLRVQPDARTAGAGYTAAPITSGPNKGYWHVVSQSWNMKRVANVNPAILSGSHRTHPVPKKDKACGPALGFGKKDAVVANFNRFNQLCKFISATFFVDAVWGHEGFGAYGGQGHESMAQAAVGDPQNDPYKPVEALVYPTEAELASVVRFRVVTIANNIGARSDDPPNGPGPSGNRPAGPIWFWDAFASTYKLYNIPGF